MFYSQRVLSRKGALRTIWVAAHCLKRVKKGQIARTNVSSSVDKIMLDEVPVVTYRVLGYLLLGLARIHSKKVEYLLQDCRRFLVKINDFVGNKKANEHIDAICTPFPSITRPDTFQLDAFDLQTLEDGSGDHVRPAEDITLKDAWENAGAGLYSLDKICCQEYASCQEIFSTAYPMLKNVLSPHFMENDMVASTSHNLNISDASIENLRCNNLSVEECLDPMSLSDFEEESGLVIPFGEKQNVGEQITFPIIENVIGTDEVSPDPFRLFEERQHINAEQIKFPEMMSPESGKCQCTADCPPSITIELTTESQYPNASGAVPSEPMIVQTPATKERARVSRRGISLLDDVVVLPNKAILKSIKGSKKLVRKRKRPSHMVFCAWKVHQNYNFPSSFFEPLIPCSSPELGSLFSKEKLKIPEEAEIVGAPEKLDNFGSRSIFGSLDQAEIASSTPLSPSSSSMLHEVPIISSSNRAVGTRSSESVGKGSSSDDDEFSFSLIDEETNSHGGDNLETNEWAVRTRNFLSQGKQREDEAVNLSEVVKGRTKSRSAKLFYEMLVLKTGGYIDVQQDAPYDDILVKETPKLKQICEVEQVDAS